MWVHLHVNIYDKLQIKFFSYNFPFAVIYEAQTLFGLGVSDTNIYNYTKLCDFIKLLAVSACQCMCRVRVHIRAS